MLVKDLCSKNVATIDRNSTIRMAAQKMRDRDVGSLVVVSEIGQPHGLLTDRDIATRLAAQGLCADETTVEDLMTHPVVSIRETANMEMALECMTFGMRRLPVVDQENRLVGVVSLDDFLLAHAKEFDRVSRVIQKELPVSEPI